MGEVRPHLPVKRLVAALACDTEALAPGREAAIAAFGAIDLESEVIPFAFTDYYRGQMGGAILRQIWSFEALADASGLAEWKLASQEIEAGLAEKLRAARPERPPRPVNLDPGYLTMGKLVLASTKDREQRIYLASGIYAEITLTRRRGKWEPSPHTFPDYASGAYGGFLEKVRARYKEQVRSAAAAHPDVRDRSG